MKSSDLTWIARENECLIVRTLPNIRKKTGEIKMLPDGTELRKQKIAELLEEVGRAIVSLQTIRLALEE